MNYKLKDIALSFFDTLTEIHVFISMSVSSQIQWNMRSQTVENTQSDSHYFKASWIISKDLRIHCSKLCVALREQPYICCVFYFISFIFSYSTFIHLFIHVYTNVSFYVIMYNNHLNHLYIHLLIRHLYYFFHCCLA